MTQSLLRAILLMSFLVLGIAAEHYAAIWSSKYNSYPFVARYGLTGYRYQLEFYKWKFRGYKIAVIDGYEVNGVPYYAAIWRKHATSNPCVSKHRMTSSNYQSSFDQYVGSGYTLTWVSGYSVDGTDYYAAIWERIPYPPLWVARHRMTSGEYQSEFDNWVGKGYRLKLVSGYCIGDTDYYAAIWEKINWAQWVARHGMTSSEYQSAFEEYQYQGYHLVHVSGYNCGGVDYYAAIWDKTPTQGYVARHGLTAPQFQTEYSYQVNQNHYSLEDLSVY
ncbi:hypothetical protein HK098_003776 [Nowakowskiella sp. JEL0407]|nr:hypothetical protein HK098_003776 [Nowakowskiella sp. JEL0407]